MTTTVHKDDIARKNAGIDRRDDISELRELKSALHSRDTEIKSWCEKAAEEIKATGQVAAETKAALEKLSEKGDEMQSRMFDIEQKMARRQPDELKAEKSAGEIFTESEDFKTLAQKGKGIASIQVKAVANITSSTTGTGGVGAAIRPDRLPGVLAPPNAEFFVRDLIMGGSTNSNAIEYVQESGFQNKAAPVAETEMKPQSDLSFELKTTTVKTLAHWIRASKQVLSDLPMLQSYINGRLSYGLRYVQEEQLLAGDGTGQNLLGLIPQATEFKTSLIQSGDTKIDILRRAILQVRLARYRASGIVLHPTDWAEMELQKDNMGQYIWVNVQVGGTPQMWRLPVVESDLLEEGSFLVGAFNIAAQVFDRELASITVSTEDGTNFTQNMVTILAEERLALAVYRPESFVHGSFA